MSTEAALACLHEHRDHSRMPLPASCRGSPLGRGAAIAAAVLWSAACSPKSDPLATPLCGNRAATAAIDLRIDTVLPAAGPALADERGTRFRLVIAFAAPAPATTAAADCSARTGTASFAGELPAGLRNAASATGEASWQIARDSVMLDLNPRARDNNIFVVLPLRGGRGHWGLSTFIGQVASGSAETAR